MTTSVIFARNHANIIGVNKGLPWSIKEDMNWFKKHTKDQVVIMGRKTMESFGGKMLPDRENYVVSSTLKVGNEHPGFYVHPNLPRAIRFITHSDFMPTTTCQLEKDVFVIGGAGLIKEAIPLVDRIYMTTVNKTVDTRGKDITRLDVTGLDGYYNEYMNVDGHRFKLLEEHNGYATDRMTGEAVGVYFTVHERVR